MSFHNNNNYNSGYYGPSGTDNYLYQTNNFSWRGIKTPTTKNAQSEGNVIGPCYDEPIICNDTVYKPVIIHKKINAVEFFLRTLESQKNSLDSIITQDNIDDSSKSKKNQQQACDQEVDQNACEDCDCEDIDDHQPISDDRFDENWFAFAKVPQNCIPSQFSLTLDNWPVELCDSKSGSLPAFALLSNIWLGLGITSRASNACNTLDIESNEMLDRAQTNENYDDTDNCFAPLYNSSLDNSHVYDSSLFMNSLQALKCFKQSVGKCLYDYPAINWNTGALNYFSNMQPNTCEGAKDLLTTKASRKYSNDHLITVPYQSGFNTSSNSAFNGINLGYCAANNRSFATTYIANQVYHSREPSPLSITDQAIISTGINKNYLYPRNRFFDNNQLSDSSVGQMITYQNCNQLYFALKTVTNYGSTRFDAYRDVDIEIDGANVGDCWVSSKNPLLGPKIPLYTIRPLFPTPTPTEILKYDWKLKIGLFTSPISANEYKNILKNLALLPIQATINIKMLVYVPDKGCVLFPEVPRFNNRNRRY